MPSIPHQKNIKSEKHLKKIREMECLICNAPPQSDPHHITFAEQSGMGRKVGDNWTVPVCRKCHGDIHLYKYGEQLFWAMQGIDPMEKAKEYYGKETT